MKFIVQLTSAINIEIDEKDQKTAFEAIAQAQEVFGIKICSKCGCDDIKYVVRENKNQDKFYELRCPKCKAKLEFGCHKKGNSLFPKRKSDDGKYLPNGGWTIYVPPTKTE